MAILEAGALASHFTLLGLDGREYALPRSLEGKPALLVFFKTSCATCDLTFPYLNRLQDSYRDGWAMWAVSQDAPDRSADYCRRYKIEYPVLIDAPEYVASRLYDPPATPTLYLVAPDGRVEYTTHGFAKDDINEISRRIAARLGAKPVVIALEKDGNPPFKPG
jgi:peroxiredoxin